MHIVYILLTYLHWWLMTCARSSDIALLSRSIKPGFVEAIKIFGEFKAVLNATEGIRDSLNQKLAEIKQMERNSSARMDCALAMSTRDDYMRTMLRGANLSTCAEFSIPGVELWIIIEVRSTSL